MKMFKYLYILLFFALACDDGIVEGEPGPLPEADFIFQVQTTNPKAVSFASTAKNFSNIIWDFGDGTGATSEAPSKTYENNGTYTVSLTASNKAGISTVRKEITIDGPDMPLADFRIDFTNTSSSLEVNLLNLSQNADEYLWDFGDGNTSTDGNLLSYTYEAPGNYTISLRAISLQDGLDDREREKVRRKDLRVLDISYLYGDGSKAWVFDPDGFEVDGEVRSSYFVLEDGDFLYDVPLEECMSNDRYSFAADGTYENENQGDGYLLAFGGQCGQVEEQSERSFSLVRTEDTSLSLFLSGGYIGDSEIGSQYNIVTLEEDLLHLAVERTSPVTGNLQTVSLIFVPENE